MGGLCAPGSSNLRPWGFLRQTGALFFPLFFFFCLGFPLKSTTTKKVQRRGDLFFSSWEFTGVFAGSSFSPGSFSTGLSPRRATGEAFRGGFGQTGDPEDANEGGLVKLSGGSVVPWMFWAPEMAKVREVR